MEKANIKPLRRGHNEGNIRQRTDGRWEVRLSAGIDYKTGKPKRTSTCCNTRQEAIAILQKQAHEVRTKGWRDPMGVTLEEWYEHWLDTYVKNSVKQSTYLSYKGYLKKHFACISKIKLKALDAGTLQELYTFKYEEEDLSPKTLRNMNMALHKCLAQAVKEDLLTNNVSEAVVLPRAERPEIEVLTNEQQREVVKASYRHRYGVFVRLALCTGLRSGELMGLQWGDIDLVAGTLQVRRTLNRLHKYEENPEGNKTEIVLSSPKTKNSRRMIPLTRGAVEDLKRWRAVQQHDKQAAGASYKDEGFVLATETGKYFEKKMLSKYYERILNDAGVGHFTFHALRHTFATRALEHGMDYKTLSALLGHYSVSFTMDTYVHCLDERKRSEIAKMDDLYDIPIELPIDGTIYPVLCRPTDDGCTLYVPDFPNLEVKAPTMQEALMKVKERILGRLRLYIHPPVPSKQEKIVVPDTCFLMLVNVA